MEVWQDRISSKDKGWCCDEGIPEEERGSMTGIRRIMAVCGTVNSCGNLVHAAAGLAAGSHAELYVLAIIYNPFGMIGLNFPRPSLWKDYRALLEKTKKDLQQLVGAAKQAGIPAYELIREGKPAEEINRVVREKEIDLLVVPAYRKTRLESLIAGRFNKMLLRKMPCSVLFLKSEPAAVPEEEENDEKEPD